MIASLLLASALAAQGMPPTTNVILILADDIGIDMLDLYDFGDFYTPGVLALTPNIEAIAAKGVTFDQAWVNPVCSPTRATMQTGRYALRTGIGEIIMQGMPPSLPTTEVLLPLALDCANYGHAIFGKWHLAHSANPTLLTGPCRGASGNGYSFGKISMFAITSEEYCDPTTDVWTPYTLTTVYENGTKTDVVATGSDYLIEQVIDEAGTWAQGFAASNPTQPWFVYLPIQAPFEVYQAPPDNLHGRTLTTLACDKFDPDTSGFAERRELYIATLEALDAKIGDLLTTLNGLYGGVPWYQHTTIYFVGDNGTPGEVVDDNFYFSSQAKRTPYEGGIRVPFIVGGSAVPSGSQGLHTDALVNGVDVFPTIVYGNAGISPAQLDPVICQEILDGVDFSTVLDDPGNASGTAFPRDWIYSEDYSFNYGPSSLPVLTGQQRVIMARHSNGDLYKLWHKPAKPGEYVPLYINSGYRRTDHFYNLASDPPESMDLLGTTVLVGEEQTILDSLYGALANEILVQKVCN